LRAVQLTVEILESRCLLSSGYLQTNIVSDIPGLARFTDPQLTNPWGVSFDPGGPFWISDNGTGLSTLYDAAGRSVSVAVSVPGSGGVFTGTAGMPTGTIFNPGPGFQISEEGRTAPGLFLFGSEDGTISGWNDLVDPTHAVLAVDNSGHGADYRGLAMAENASGSLLFAADFGTGTIDVFDQHFDSVKLAGTFADPALPAGFAPFNVQDIGGKLFVTYALRNAAGTDEVYGAGDGFIDVFDTNGNLLSHFAAQGNLNAPWGLALAPPDFGAFSNDLLVGNVGDGRINAFDPNTGAWLGQLQDAAGNAVVLPDVWALAFGGGGGSGDPHTLFFTAGIQDENHGLFGSLQSADNVDTHGTDASEKLYATDDPGEIPYPLPPPVAPVFREGVEGHLAELPVALPLKASSFSPAPDAEATSDRNLATATESAFTSWASRTEPVRLTPLGAASGANARPVIHAGPGQERAAHAGSLQAVDMLLALNVQALAGNEVVPVEQVRSQENGSGSAAIVPASLSEGPVPGAAPRPAISEESRHRHAGSPNLVSVWFSLPLALGVYLAWSCRQAAEQAVGTEERRPPSLRS